MDTEPPTNHPQSEGISHQPPVLAATGPAAEDTLIASGRASAAQIATGNQLESDCADTSPEDSSAMAASSSDGNCKPIPTGFDRQIHVFTREAVAAAEASNRCSPPNFPQSDCSLLQIT